MSDGSYSVLNIQDYFEIIRKHEKLTGNPPIQNYINKTGNKITLKIKSGHYVEILTAEKMESFNSTKRRITKENMVENVSQQ